MVLTNFGEAGPLMIAETDPRDLGIKATGLTIMPLRRPTCLESMAIEAL